MGILSQEEPPHVIMKLPLRIKHNWDVGIILGFLQGPTYQVKEKVSRRSSISHGNYSHIISPSFQTLEATTTPQAPLLEYPK